ncbi:MAG: hypothetical protein FWH07_01705 [Oscillospiraceae bacterium]|nr:hypothetical protein [Oscillospiraceae bacterium]
MKSKVLSMLLTVAVAIAVFPSAGITVNSNTGIGEDTIIIDTLIPPGQPLEQVRLYVSDNQFRTIIVREHRLLKPLSSIEIVFDAHYAGVGIQNFEFKKHIPYTLPEAKHAPHSDGRIDFSPPAAVTDDTFLYHFYLGLNYDDVKEKIGPNAGTFLLGKIIFAAEDGTIQEAELAVTYGTPLTGHMSDPGAVLPAGFTGQTYSEDLPVRDYYGRGLSDFSHRIGSVPDGVGIGYTNAVPPGLSIVDGRLVGTPQTPGKYIILIDCKREESDWLNVPNGDIRQTWSYVFIEISDAPMLGRIIDADTEPTIFDALEILKFLVGMDGVIKDGGRESRAWKAALITEQSQIRGEPDIFDVLEVLKYLVGMPGRVESVV